MISVSHYPLGSGQLLRLNRPPSPATLTKRLLLWFHFFYIFLHLLGGFLGRSEQRILNCKVTSRCRKGLLLKKPLYSWTPCHEPSRKKILFLIFCKIHFSKVDEFHFFEITVIQVQHFFLSTFCPFHCLGVVAPLFYLFIYLFFSYFLGCSHGIWRFPG